MFYACVYHSWKCYADNLQSSQFNPHHFIKNRALLCSVQRGLFARCRRHRFGEGSGFGRVVTPPHLLPNLKNDKNKRLQKKDRNSENFKIQKRKKKRPRKMKRNRKNAQKKKNEKKKKRRRAGGPKGGRTQNFALFLSQRGLLVEKFLKCARLEEFSGPFKNTTKIPREDPQREKERTWEHRSQYNGTTCVTECFEIQNIFPRTCDAVQLVFSSRRQQPGTLPQGAH